MIHSLLRTPDSPNARRNKFTGGYTYGLYHRERVLFVAQSTEGRAAKRRWDETLHGNTPNPGWTTRLGDIGRALGITAVAAGKLLELLGYRCGKHVTDSAVAAGCGVRRWDGFAMHDDWHSDRVVFAIGLVARKHQLEETEAGRRREEEAMISGLQVELRALCATDSGIKPPHGGGIHHSSPCPPYRSL
jgi:hypothetical protein